MKYLFLFALSLLLLLSACKDKTGPVISWQYPIDTLEFENGDTMHVHGTVTDDGSLTEVILTVTDISNSSEKRNIHDHPTSNSHNFETEYVVDVPNHSNIEVKVVATDGNSNVTTDSRTFHIMQ